MESQIIILCKNSVSKTSLEGSREGTEVVSPPVDRRRHGSGRGSCVHPDL